MTIRTSTALKPALTQIVTAGVAIGLGNRELLHAGPPLSDPLNPPPVLVSSAVMTALHERWADTEVEAEKLVRRGAIQWRCAQDFQCVTPLAATISQSTPLFKISEPERARPSRYSIVSCVGGPDTRMGNRDATLAARMRVRDEQLAPAWQAWLDQHGPLSLTAIAQQGITGGDDLHFRTTSASQALGMALSREDTNAWTKAIGDTPTYFLTLWMAACAMLIDSAGQDGNKTTVVRAGGNGESFGLSLASHPAQWTSEPALAPAGAIAPASSNTTVCPAIGDSAVIDFAGFGAQGLSHAKEAREAFSRAGVLPSDFAEIASKIGLNGALSESGIGNQGVDAAMVLESSTTPLVALAMLDSTGVRGLLGRGLYRTELSLYQKAVSS